MNTQSEPERNEKNLDQKTPKQYTRELISSRKTPHKPNEDRSRLR